ncbi:MAG: hypothetical protein A2Y38_07075 [Spirochaetes bacterium GWB1_59_5]|nr:MAG: hypothetical protein A2Y38_07075 [Spirochaetes bacterium GWB1_59_5]
MDDEMARHSPDGAAQRAGTSWMTKRRCRAIRFKSSPTRTIARRLRAFRSYPLCAHPGCLVNARAGILKAPVLLQS